MTESLWNLAAQNSLRGSLLIACVLLLRFACRNRLPAQVFHLLWLVVAVRLLLPMAPSAPSSVFNLFVTPAPTAKVAEPDWRVRLGTAISTPEPTGPPPTRQATSQPEMPTLHWIAVVWLGGVAVQIAMLAKSLSSMHRRLKDSVEIADPHFLESLHRSAEKVGIRVRFRVMETHAVAAPAVMGFWRPKLLLPPGLQRRLTERELHFVLLHECMHLRRRDLPAMGLLVAARIVHWFNPLVWVAARFARTDAEVACDESVLRHHAAPRAYGETLLKLARQRTLPLPPETPYPSYGILGSKRTLRRRLERIGRFSPPTRVQALVGFLLVAAVAVVFGADETKRPDSSEEAATPTAASSPGWADGWKVVRVTIPSSGVVGHAFVDLKTPAGREVTLTEGVLSKEGVTLAKVEWSGSPIRAKVVLRKGEERAELFAKADGVSRNDALSRRTPQIEIEAKFVEMPREVAEDVPMLRDIAPGNTGFGGLAGVMQVKEDEKLFRELYRRKGVDVLSTPRVTTRSQQRAVIEMIREFRYPTGWDPPDEKSEHWTPNKFETTNVGATLEVEPTVNDDDTLALELSPQVVEFDGFIDYVTKEPIAKPKHEASRSFSERAIAPVPESFFKPLPDRTQPVFSTRKTECSVTILPGQSVVLVLGEANRNKPFDSPGEGKLLVAIVTARQISPEEPPQETKEPPSPPSRTQFKAVPGDSARKDELPEATPVDGKPGLVFSPFSPDGLYIDVRGIDSGTKIKCPWTGRYFRVP